jgi:hypothetical protein
LVIPTFDTAAFPSFSPFIKSTKTTETVLQPSQIENAVFFNLIMINTGPRKSPPVALLFNKKPAPYLYSLKSY